MSSAATFALKVEAVSKTFSLNRTADHHFGKTIVGHTTPNVVQALNNINFQLGKGEVLGIIGANGAGKSTLLKIISGIVKPSAGKVYINGNLASILEVGTGFHPDLSGYDNILLTGSLNGKSKNEVLQSVQDIVNFSGLADYIDTPVKYYSSGMFMRLAFATATHMDADIVLLDEVFSVGDMEFRAKCLDKIRSLISDNKTIVLVSHDLGIIKTICSQCLILDKGHLLKAGLVQDVMEEYIEKSFNKTDDAHGEPNRQNGYAGPDIGNDVMKLCSMSIKAAHGGEIQMTDDILISYTFHKFKSMRGRASLNIKSEQQMHIMALSPYRNTSYMDIDSDTDKGIYTVSTRIPAGLFNRGLFIIDFVFIDEADNLLLHLSDVCYFKVLFKLNATDTSLYEGAYQGPLMPILPWEVKKTSITNSEQ